MLKSTADARIAVIVVAGYFVAGLLVLPGADILPVLGRAALVFGVVAGVARVWPAARMSTLTILAVTFIAAFALIVPLLPVARGSSLTPLVVAAVGTQVATLLWAALRWDPVRARRSHLTLSQLSRYALWAAGGLSLVASFPIFAAVLAHVPEAGQMFWIYPAYLVGFVTAAVAIWALQPIAHLAIGRYVVGVVGGTMFYLAITPVILATRHEPVTWGMMLVLGYVCGAMVGPAVVFSS